MYDKVVDLQLPVQSVPITTIVVSSYPAHGEVYSTYYVIKVVSDLRQVGGFSYEVKIHPVKSIVAIKEQYH
jgi:hypothetical protein